MSGDSLLRDVLFIPKHHQKRVSPSRFICLVHDDWLRSLRQGILQDCPKSVLIGSDDASLLLAPSHESLPKHWARVSIKIVHKNDTLCKRLHSGPFYNTSPVKSCFEHLKQTARDNFRNLWAEAHLRYGRYDHETVKETEEKFTHIMQSYLRRLRPEVYISIPSQSHDSEHLPSNQPGHHDNPLRNNAIATIAVIETKSTFYIVQPYIAYSLWDLVSYSPAVFEHSHAKPLFILYQILQSMGHFHNLGVGVGKLTLDNVRIDEKLWVYCTHPHSASFQIYKDPGHNTDSLSSTAAINKNKSEDDFAATTVQMDDVSIGSVLSESISLSTSDIDSLAFRQSSHKSEGDSHLAEALNVMDEFRVLSIDINNLGAITQDWVNHKMSNFRYLMYLNFLAGRRLGDPNHHPVLPWVMDFSSAHSGLRDLRMSKFRLNKGDSQLDFTFTSMTGVGEDSEHVPHHISDVLSDITYYVYKARRTPKHLLCVYVRSKWVPNEYPSSIERMYQWTPDECIPEFFTDPSIFSSIHEDLPSLELPWWCSSPVEFVEKHISMLESKQVSSEIHHWIDTTFGYKLSGTSAEESKNVHLRLVDGHTKIQNHGVLQLFQHPHPHQLHGHKTLSLLPVRVIKSGMRSLSNASSTDSQFVRDPDFDTIKLPEYFDPTAALEHFEALHSFTLNASSGLPPNTNRGKTREKKFSDLHDHMRTIWQDMQNFACVMCEIFLVPQVLVQGRGTSLRDRYNMIGRLYAKNRHKIPRVIQTAVVILLRLNEFSELASDDKQMGNGLLFEYPMVNSLGLPPPTPAQLLQTSCDVIPFPPYFSDLFDILNKIKTIDLEVNSEMNSTKSRVDKIKAEKVLMRKKVEILETYLRTNHGKLTKEGFELLLPYIKELFGNSVTTVQASWAILSHVGQELGPKALSKHLLPFLSHVFNGEETTPKHMKLYHRSFLVQLLQNLGLETFLPNFSTLLVEAVAGYKNFVVLPDNLQDDTEEGDEEMFPNGDGNDVDQSTVLNDDDAVEVHEPIEQNLDAITEGEDDDVRPDQQDTEDTDPPYADDLDDIVDPGEGGYSGEGNNSGEGDFTSFPSMGHHNLSVDSLSTDQLSQLSENEVGTDDAGGSGSLDCASVHSVSHILNLSEDSSGRYLTNEDISTEKREKNGHFVRFEQEEPDFELDDKSKDIEIQMDQSKETTIQMDQSEPEQKIQTDQLKTRKNEEEIDADSESKSVFNMIRSETDEFRQIHQSQTINICDVAAESIKWLSHRLGPLLSAKYLSKNLVRMLALCYLGDEQIIVLQENNADLPKSTRQVQGDLNAHKVLECLNYVACLYGEHVILIQYIPCIIDLIHVAKKRLTIRAEAGLVAAVVLLRDVIPLLSDKTFLQMLQDTVLMEALRPIIKLVSTSSISFPSGPVVRSLILYKIIDVLYIIGLRLGFEMTREKMTRTLQLFFLPFEQVYSPENPILTSGSVDILKESGNISEKGLMESGSVDDSFLQIKMDAYTQQYMIGSPVRLAAKGSPSDHMMRKSKNLRSNYSLTDTHISDDRDDAVDGKSASEELLQTEFRQTYTPELALAAYIPLTSVFGSHHMEESLPNDDLIRKLCAQFDSALYTDNENIDSESCEEHTKADNAPAVKGDLGSNVAIVGNQICLQDSAELETIPDTLHLRKHFQHRGILRIDPDDTKSTEMEQKTQRHLKGNWLAYWEHELGLNERDTLFNFKQIKLQIFQGHKNSIRSLTRLDSENSFISASKDTTVKLWSIQNFGDGNGRCRCQYTYGDHKKSVFSVAYLENLRLVASCDSTVHIWDPFMGETVRQLESSRYSPVIALCPLPSPSNMVVTATTDNTLRFLDVRASRYAHEYKCVIGSHGAIRSLTTSSDGAWVMVGFSSGVISVLSTHTGMLQGSFKAHDGEILQMKGYNKTCFLSTAFDLTMKMWSVEGASFKEVCSFKGQTEPIHCVGFYRNQIVSATTSNKIGVHTSVDNQANFSSTKLRSEVFKGVLTCMEILPLNRTLLLGADNGLIRLLC
ncbi:WD repeat-containing protein 81-like [Dreissena polymorpha]|uniref:BEACH domain-containing protein n=1 Tax=Dreissena polymorpha TaxID=45954 RepID=A0A9D4KS91_DREPO|nr:WD repeat-containing protein 81-like [Dreissena polymorpha]KAH3845168.1 hypothetical protein DPMN_087441 [Dreissena polymorpha]